MSVSNHPVEQEELMAYLDGEFEADRGPETASHLEQCPDCQKLAADLRDVSEMLMVWQVEEAELEPTEDGVEALEESRSHKNVSADRGSWRNFLSPRHWPKPVWGLAGAGLIVVVVVGVNLTVHRPNADFASLPSVTLPSSAPKPSATPKSGPADFYSPHQPSKSTRAHAVIQGREDINGDMSQTLNWRAALPSGTLGKLERDKVEADEQETSGVPSANGPMIIRTADLEVKTDAFDKARPGVEEILKRHHGYVGELNVNTPAGAARSLTGTLRVPASQLDATLSDLKGLGRTEKESQGGEEVTQQYVDLEARLANSKHTEQRLTDILRQRTGKLSDVLAVEMQISRVRGEIEQMEAARKSMKNQVDYATLNLTVTEDYKAELNGVPPSTSTQFRNAAVEGYRSLVDGIIAVLLWLLSVGPTLLLWGAILFFPARMLWRRLRPRFAK